MPRPRRRAATAARSSNSSFIIGPQAKTRSTPAASTASFRPRCRSADASPSSSMSPSTATRRGKSSRGVVAMAASAARIGGRVGVVALVDQQDAPPRGASSSVRAPRPAGAAMRASAGSAAHDVDAERLQGGEHGQRVLDVVLARARRRGRESAASRLPAITDEPLAPRSTCTHAHVGLLVVAERDDPGADAARRARAAAAKCGLSRGRTAAPPGTRPLKISALASAISSTDWK